MLSYQEYTRVRDSCYIEGCDRGYVLATTIRMILKQLDLLDLPTIIYTDSYSLYEYLVKLGTTKKKRLIIDIIAFRQSYELRELYEIR
jgi:hypothetical protein